MTASRHHHWFIALALAVVGVATAAVTTTLAGRPMPDSPSSAVPRDFPSVTPSAPPQRHCASRLPRRPTIFGVSLRTAGRTATQALDNERRKFGDVRIVRVFNPSLPPPGVWTSPETAVPTGVDVAISFRARPRAVLSGRLDGALHAFFDQAPRNREIYWTYNHEPEQEIAQGDYTSADYRAAWRHITRLSRTACNSHLHATLILTGFTANPFSRRDWRSYYPGSPSIDVVAWDVYNRANRTPTRYEDPLTLFGTLTVIAQEARKPLAITEMGSARVLSDTTGDRRADWLGLSAAFLAQQNAVFVIYFDSTRNGNFLLDDEPSITEWRRWVERADSVGERLRRR